MICGRPLERPFRPYMGTLPAFKADVLACCASWLVLTEDCREQQQHYRESRWEIVSGSCDGANSSHSSWLLGTPACTVCLLFIVLGVGATTPATHCSLHCTTVVNQADVHIGMPAASNPQELHCAATTLIQHCPGCISRCAVVWLCMLACNQLSGCS
jgi:hypothetical protein